MDSAITVDLPSNAIYSRPYKTAKWTKTHPQLPVKCQSSSPSYHKANLKRTKKKNKYSHDTIIWTIFCFSINISEMFMGEKEILSCKFWNNCLLQLRWLEAEHLNCQSSSATNLSLSGFGTVFESHRFCIHLSSYAGFCGLIVLALFTTV